jgi:hypothetical protein
MKERFCSGPWNCCPHAGNSNTTGAMDCHYWGYCDYQVPKDSRSWNNFCAFGNENKEKDD